jgi:RES domain-containing protein
LPLDPDQHAALASLPLRRITGVFYRQTRPKRQALELAATAPHEARWHYRGDPWPAYAGDSPLSVMLEQPRHFEFASGDEPVLAIRRLSELHVEDLATIDLANALALDQLKLAVDDVRGDGTEDLCRAIASATWQHHPDAHAMLVPSTPAPGRTVLVIRPAGFDHIEVGATSLVQLNLRKVSEGPEDDTDREAAD